ncbi:MAG: hypothetical protein JKY89_10965 [Immundisolibacteraceae bacterium]|nr:hypothetical protein [Immundisolibacteraceae bacterium]
MSHSQKISSFTGEAALTGTDLITFVRAGTNFNVTFTGLINSLGVTGTLEPIGAPSGTPVLNQPAAGINEIRNIESGPGILASISPESGITIKWNVAQDNIGVPLTSGLNNSEPVISSLFAGQGISIVKDGDKITLTNTVDPATGLSNRVVVTEAADLSGVLDSTKEYFIDGIVNMGSQSIEVPAGGLSLTGYNFDVSKLISSTASYTMFTSPAGGSGNLIGKDYAIEVTGAGSQVYNLTSDTGFEAFEFSRVNYNDCESLGSINNYRQGLEVGTGRFGGKPELELIGAWLGGYFIDTSIVRSLDDGAYSLFKAGAGFVMTSRFRTNQNIDLPASTSFVDFSASNFVNPSTLQFEGCLISRGGVFDATDSNITPNVAASALISKWTDNNGIPNTFVGGEANITAEITTTITTTATFEDLAGTYTTSDLQHFDSPANGQLRHLGNSPREFDVTGQLVLESSSNDEVDLKLVIFRAATTSFEDGKTIRRVINNLQGGRNVAYFVMSDHITLDQNDYVKLQVAQVSPSTADITAELDSFFILEAR